MSNDRDDAQGRRETPAGRPAGGYPDPWQVPSSYGVPQHPQGQYGQSQYGQPQYGYAQYGQPPFGQVQPARPGTVITAAVLGLVFGALGLLVTVGLLAGGALIDDLVKAIADNDPTVDTGQASSSVDEIRAAFVAVAVLALAWTVVMIWGSALALRGRSRVLLLVGSSIAVAATGLVFLGGVVGMVTDPGTNGQVGGVLFLSLFFLAALAMLVLLCLRSAGQFFTAHRQRRALLPR
jgi:hypothetical protein